LTAARRAFRQGEQTLSLVRGKPAELTQSFIGAAGAFRDAMDAAKPVISNAEKTIDNIRAITNQDSKDRHMLDNMIKELSSAARSIRVWAEYLERHPEALIRGKGGPKRR
jgi:paraquat-inducible protein B